MVSSLFVYAMLVYIEVSIIVGWVCSFFGVCVVVCVHAHMYMYTHTALIFARLLVYCNINFILYLLILFI